MVLLTLFLLLLVCALLTYYGVLEETIFFIYDTLILTVFHYIINL